MDVQTEELSTNRATKSDIRVAAMDIFLVLATLLILKSVLLEIEALWTYAGPISLLASLGVASWRLRKSNETWASLGLKRPQSWSKTLAWTLAALVLTTAAGIFAETFVNTVAGGTFPQPEGSNSGRFADVPGNTILYLYWLAVAWTIGGFTEEMLFRALLITRFERLFSRLPFGLFLAILFPAIIFGQQHYYYQGMSGALATGAIAVVSGCLYLFLKRNLWPLVLSHGLVNTIGLTLIYLGIQPTG